jgi:multimeric flavodoxin WrbA
MTLSEIVRKLTMTGKEWDFTGMKAIFFNGTLTKSPEASHTEKLIKISQGIMEKHGVQTEIIRSIDHDIAVGVWPDMSEHGYKTDEWPEIFKRVMEADILVLAGPIWLGDNSSETKKVIERLYACSGQLNSFGQYAFYGKVGGCLITGNEDGIKHCAMNILYSLQHLGCTIPPQADSGWIGEAGPGDSYGDEQPDGTKLGFNNDFTNRNTTFMTWNLLHQAKMLKDNGGIPAYGNQRSKWDAGSHFDFNNPEYR